MKLALALALGVLAACGGAPSPTAAPPSNTAATPPPTLREHVRLDVRFSGMIEAASKQYATWTRLDDLPHVAPALCAAPTPPADPEPTLRISAAEDGPHELKLYFLWASDQVAYRTPTTFATGFAIVKQSFEATETAPAHGGTSLVHDGHTLYAGAPNDLFVMTKVSDDPTADGTDHGWVYGTVDATGWVSSAGRVESCMSCHADATHERLFGLSNKVQ